MSWKRGRPRVFEKVEQWRGDERVTIPIYYQPKTHDEEEHFFAEVDGQQVRGDKPGEVKAKLPELLKEAFTYSGWAFWLKIEQTGGRGHEWNDQSYDRSASEGIDVSYELHLLGKRSDGKRVKAPCHLSTDGVPHVGPANGKRTGKYNVSFIGACCTRQETNPSKADPMKAEELHGDADGFVPFTPERLAWLRRLEDAVAKVRAEIGKILDGTGKALAKKLDAAVAAQSGIPLLPPAAKEKHE